MADGTDRVIYRKWKRFAGFFGQESIIALFPNDVDRNGYMTCYEHVGQTGDCDYPFVLQHTVPVSFEDKEVQELHKELLSLGYITKDTLIRKRR